MDWKLRSGRAPSPSDRQAEGGTATTGAAAPGIAALLADVTEDRTHTILDLGPGAGSSLDVYRRFARTVRFADVDGFMQSPGGTGGVAGMLAAVPPEPDEPYDLIFAWDILDRLFPDYRAALVHRLASVTVRRGRLHTIVRAPGKEPVPPLRFSLLDTDRMLYTPTGPPEPARERLLPAEVTPMLEPFRVIHGFTLRAGLREYVAVRDR